jgi:hypothetical protein
MPYYDTIDEDLARAKEILADGVADAQQFEWMAQLSGGTIYGKDIYAAYKLLESFVAEIERLRGADVQAAVTEALKTIRCDCGALAVQCASCAVADWQAAHPDCPTCCPPIGAEGASPLPQCERCGGTGQQYPGLWNMETQAYDTKAGTCDDCKGTGRLEA